MSARRQAQRPASDLDLIASNGCLPVHPGISGLGHQPTLTTGSFLASRLDEGTAELKTVPDEWYDVARAFFW